MLNILKNTAEALIKLHEDIKATDDLYPTLGITRSDLGFMKHTEKHLTKRVHLLYAEVRLLKEMNINVDISDKDDEAYEANQVRIRLIHVIDEQEIRLKKRNTRVKTEE